MNTSATARLSISQADISRIVAFARALTSPSPQAPARIRAAVERYEAESDRIAGFAQLAGVLLFAALYAATYSSFAVHHTIEPAPIAIAAYGAATLWRLRQGGRSGGGALKTYASAATDVVALYALIAAFPFQYEAPAALYLKAPTLLYVFILIALRTLWFDPRLTIFTGGLAALGWGALSVTAAAGGAVAGVEPGRVGRHRGARRHQQGRCTAKVLQRNGLAVNIDE